MQDVRCHARTPRQPCAATPEIVIIAMLYTSCRRRRQRDPKNGCLLPGRVPNIARMCRPRSNAIDRLLDEIFDHTPEHPRPASRVIQVSVERPEHWAQLEPIGNVRDDRSHHLNLQTNELQVKPSPATDWHSI